MSLDLEFAKDNKDNWHSTCDFYNKNKLLLFPDGSSFNSTP